MGNAFKGDNIELGAGCGNFGQRFYPVCLLTDADEGIGTRCSNNHIDLCCSANEIPVGDDSFRVAIICNPWQYGFNDPSEGIQILEEIVRVLKGRGRIIIIGSLTNKYCAPEKVSKTIDAAKSRLSAQLTIRCVKAIDSKKEYGDYIFRTSGGDEIFPSMRIEIDVTK